MKTKIVVSIALLAFLLLVFIIELSPRTVKISTSEELMSFFSQRQKNVEVILAGGEYILSPTSFIDSTCANCENANITSSGTYGLKISGKNIKITGPEDRSAIIHTNSGYGLFALDCSGLHLQNLTITGGIRDSAATASNAAIVVKNSSARIHNNLIKNNIGDSLLIAKNVSGIMGICGRESSYLEITDNEIVRNSWDAITLFRDTKAVIRGNIIDGVDKVVGRAVGGGRGVAIGVTWNASAEISNNYITRYWKGIGIFVDAAAVVENNIIEDMITWGISLWDADRGKPQGVISNNIIYKTGAMGVGITSSTEKNPGLFLHNIIVQTAQNPAYDSSDYYGFQCALALHSVPADFEIGDNIFYYNRRASELLPDYDLSESQFRQHLQDNKNEFKKFKFFEKSAFGKLDKTDNSRNSLDWEGIYHGVLPSADCSGIETTIELKQNGSFMIQRKYLGKGDDIMDENGNFIWSPDGRIIHLINPTNPCEFRQYQVGENLLFQLDEKGKRIAGNLAENYILKKIMI